MTWGKVSTKACHLLVSLIGCCERCTAYSVVWVAFWGFLAAAQAGTGKQIAMVIGISTAVICGILAICGTILASRSHANPTDLPPYKAVSDPDAYDFVGRRG